MLLETPIRVFCNGSNEKGLAVIAGLSGDDRAATILVSNYDREFNSYDIRVRNLWEGSRVRYEVYVLDGSRNLELVRTEEAVSPSFSIFEDVEVTSVLMIKVIKT